MTPVLQYACPGCVEGIALALAGVPLFRWFWIRWRKR